MKRRYSARFKTMGVIGFVIIMISIINLPAKAYSNEYASAVLSLTDSSVESDWEVCALATDLYAINSSVSNKNVRFWAYRKNSLCRGEVLLFHCQHLEIHMDRLLSRVVLLALDHQDAMV